MPVLSLPIDAVMESLPPDAVLESGAPPPTMGSAGQVALPQALPSRLLPDDAVMESPAPPTSIMGGNQFISPNQASKLFSGQSRAQPTPMDQNMPREDDATPQPTQTALEGIENVPENAKGHLIHAAGSFLDMMNIYANPTLSKFAQGIKDTGRRTIEQNPVTNPAGQIASAAWNLASLYGAAGAAPAVMGGIGAGEEHTKIMDTKLAQGATPEQARRAANFGAPLAGAAGYASAFLYPGVPATGNVILNKAIGGAAGSLVQGITGKAVDQVTTGQSQSAADIAKDAATSAAVNSAFGAFEHMMGTPKATWQIPDEYKPTFVKMQQIRQGVADGTIDPTIGNQAMQSAVAGGTGDTGFVSKARTGEAVINPTGGVVLTPRDGAVIRSLFTDEKAPPLDSAVPSTPQSVQSKVTSAEPVPTDLQPINPELIQKGGAQREIQEGQAQGQEVLNPAQAQSQSTGAAGAPVAPVSSIPSGVMPPDAVMESPAPQVNPGAVSAAAINSPEFSSKDPGSPTSVKNAVTEIERAVRGIPAADQPDVLPDKTVWEAAKSEYAADPRVADDLVNELTSQPRALNDRDVAVLGIRQVELQNQFQDVNNKIVDAFKAGDDAMMAEQQARRAVLSDQLQNVYDVGKAGGTESARGLRFRQMMIANDFTLAKMEVNKRAANGGRPLTPNEQATLAAQHDKIVKTQKAADDQTEKKTEGQRDIASKRAVRSLVKDAHANAGKPKGVQLGDAVESLKAKVTDNKIGADLAFDIQKIARHFVEKGIRERDALVTAVHGVIKDIVPGITPRLTQDAISGYGNYKQLSKDQVSVALRDLKGQMQQVAKLEDMISKGIPPLKTGIERRTPSDEERRLIKEVNETTRRLGLKVTDPATQLKSALAAFKTRTTNRITDLNAKIAAGDFSTTPRTPLALDAEALKLKAAADRAKQEFQRGLTLDRMKNRTMNEKVQDAIVKWRRGFLLSSPVTLAKLTSAGAERMLFSPIEEGIGGAISQVFPRLAAKASLEGGFSIAAEAKAITEGFTKGISDAAQTIRTGRSDLEVVYGKGIGLPRDVSDFMGSLHGALKTVTKRAAFARAFQKLTESSMRNGLDVTDPMVQSRNAIAAYKEANKSIFMQDNRVVSAFKRALSALDEKDKATGKVPMSSKVIATTLRAALPIVRVPTNIVAETLQYAAGLPIGGAKMAAAYAKGIDSINPGEADAIMSMLKKGLLGAALLLLGFFAKDHIGGYYQAGQKRDPKDVGFGKVRVFGFDIPSYLIHNPLLETLQIGATIGRVADSKLRQKDSQTQGIGPGSIAAALGLLGEVPFAREAALVGELLDPRSRSSAAGQLAQSVVVPQAVSFVAQHTDKDDAGNPVKRKPQGIGQSIEMGIPGLRQNVPAMVDKDKVVKSINAAYKASFVDGVKALQQAVDSKEITQAEANAIKKTGGRMTNLEYRVKGMDSAEAIKTFDAIDDDDKAIIRAEVLKKIINSKTLNPDQKRALIAPVRDWRKAG